jgi:arylsulfatase A-like enzyme
VRRDNDDIVLNVDFPALFLDLAGVPIPADFQGRSFRPLLQGSTPPDWRQAMYYRYWMNAAHHNVAAHYGIRTHKYKLIYYYYDGCDQPGTDAGHVAGDRDIMALDGLEPEWELFDLEKDPCELNNVVDDPAYAGVVRELKDELHRLQAEVGDERYAADKD